MPLPEHSGYTAEDIYNLSDGVRAELINGQIYYMAPPTVTHQRISGWLYAKIFNHIEQKDGPCEVFAAPFATFLNDDDETYVEPDVAVICDKDKLDDKGCHGAPDWVIEIVSPSSKRMDYYTKLSLYRSAGVREYWIVDSARKSVMVYYMEEDAAPVIYHFTDKVRANIYPDLEIDFNNLMV